MCRINCVAVLTILAIVPLQAQQTAGGRVAFEVASIRPSDPDNRQTRMGMAPGGQFAAENVSLKRLIAFAYDIHEEEIIGGPAWIDSLGYDIEAKAPDANGLPAGRGSVPTFRAMLEVLLAERFQLAVHQEIREKPAYELVVARSGVKLREVEAVSEKGRQHGVQGGRGQLMGYAVPSSAVADVLTQALGRPVADKTMLKGAYDFTLTWTPDPTEPTNRAEEVVPLDPAGPSLFTAVEEQLGLRLTAVKAAVNVLVVDRAEKASEN